MKEHDLDSDIHVFKIGEKKLTVKVPTIRQQREFAKKAKGIDEENSFDLMGDYFESLGINKDDFEELTVSQMTAMLKVVNEVPK